MKWARTLIGLFAVAASYAAQPAPETTAAFDRYIKVTEDEMARHRGFEDFLWVDHDAKQKSAVWLGQSPLRPMQTLDQGHEIEVPGGLIQHWLGTLYVDQVTIDPVRNSILNIAAYKDFFRPQVRDSKLVKPNGYQFDLQLRLYRRQVSAVLLNASVSCDYTPVDDKRVFIACRSTHIGEVEHPKDQKSWDKERPVEDETGYLWRFNYYWRIAEADNGVYVELETISLGRETGGLSPSHFLNDFQNFPKELTQSMIDGLRNLLQRHR
jgi:hypothetical protein